MINKLILLVLLLMPAITMAGNNAPTVARWYKIYWNKTYIADLKVELGEGSMTAKIDSRGVVLAVSKYRNYVYSHFLHEVDTYMPIDFVSKLTQRQGDKQVEIEYSKDGKISKEKVTPPDNRTKRTAVPEDMKDGVVDPLFAALVAREKIKIALKNGYKTVDFNIYDGRRLSKLEFVIDGKETIKTLAKKVDVVKISFKRVALSGYTKNELKRMKGEEPDFVVYLEEGSLLPLKADAAAPLGKAEFILQKECLSIDTCI